MPKKTLAAGQEERIPTTGMFLSIINATAQFYIEAPEFGTLAGKVGRQYELIDISEVNFINSGVDPVDIEYEVANIKIHGSGSGTVSIENEIVVKRINESISVAASIENGSVFGIEPTLNEVALEAGGNIVRIDPANNAVDIDGQTVVINGQTVVIDGQSVLLDSSGNTVKIDPANNAVDIDGQTVDVAGQAILLDATGNTVKLDSNNALVTVARPGTLNNSTVQLPNGAPAQILPANASRATVVIVPDQDCYLGGSGLTASNARLIAAGEPWKSTGTYAVFAVDAGAAGAVNGTTIEEEVF